MLTGLSSPQMARELQKRLLVQSILAGASRKKIVLKEFRDSFFPYIGGEIKEYFETLKHEIKPDLIFTHYRDDLHQDHGWCPS